MMAYPAGKFTEMVGAYVAEKTGMTLVPGQYAAMMVVNDNNDFVAGVVVSNFRGTDCELSCASETGAAWRPHVLRAIFTYVFTQLGCVRCTSITTKRNRPARKFLESLGFVLEGNLRQGYDGKIDALIYGLLAVECRYLAGYSEEDDGQKVSTIGSGGTGPDGDSASADGRGEGRRDHGSELEPDQSSNPTGELDVHADGDEPGRDAAVHADADVLA